tara:strand:- start:64 stop:645 length:582 start_codon:yes stop_codon:yes gene_type:complete
MTGKIRVSIVATALDGHKNENKTVLNMVTRIQNRNTGYSENLFSQNPRVENNTLGSIDGATALKLDESYQIQEEKQSSSLNNVENDLENESLIGALTEAEKISSDIPSGVSIESASYIERNNFQENDNVALTSENKEEEHTPKLFSEGQDSQSDEKSIETTDEENRDSDQLFDQDINEEEDFEIPAFLRKQKF